MITNSRRQDLQAVVGRVSAAADLKTSVVLSPAESALLWEHIRTEKWRTKCKRKHLEDLEAEGRLLPPRKKEKP